MRHFFTKGTVEASIWCMKCGRATMWTIGGGQPMYCKVCYAKPQVETVAESPVPVSGNLFE